MPLAILYQYSKYERIYEPAVAEEEESEKSEEENSHGQMWTSAHSL